MGTFDVAVIGLGAMGSAAAYHLASRGARVLGLERFERGHTLASFGGRSRIIRQSYFEHPDYVPLLRRAWALWRALEEASGESLLTATGGLMLAGIGLRLLRLRDVPVGNMLPAVLVAPVLTAVVAAFRV